MQICLYIYSIKYLVDFIAIVLLLACFYNNKAYIISCGAYKLFIDLEIEEQKLQGIGFYKGVENINISFYKELKAIK